MAIYGEQGKMPVVIIGPRGGNIHSSDEWVLLEDIYSLTGLFAMMIKEWCGR
jgi:acetylornithine deacetylase